MVLLEGTRSIGFLDLLENLFWHYVVRDRKHAESVYEKCKGENYTLLPIHCVLFHCFG